MYMKCVKKFNYRYNLVSGNKIYSLNRSQIQLRKVWLRCDSC